MSFTYEDIEPVKLNEEDPQLCRILYTEEYKQTMGILLALMQAKEYSERALAMTELGIEMLASHYSTWIYRYNIVKALGKDLLEELDWLESVALENEKNYQIWNYRQLIIKEVLAQKGQYNVNREFPIVAAMLQEDAKNHHVWSYRRWLVSEFDLFDNEKELDSIDYLLKEDIRNNSAWNHRFFLKFGKPDVSSDIIDAELEYVKHAIKQSPQNESTWNYLLGIYGKFDIDLKTLEPFCKEFVDMAILKTPEAIDSDEIDLIKSSFALEVLAKVYKNDLSLRIYDLLIEKYDPVRQNYWNYLKSTV